MAAEARHNSRARSRQSQQHLIDRNAQRGCSWTARGARNPVPSNLSLATSLPLPTARHFPFLGQTHKSAAKASMPLQALLSIRTADVSTSCTQSGELLTGCKTGQFQSRTGPLASFLAQASGSHATLYITGLSSLAGPPLEHEDAPNSGDNVCGRSCSTSAQHRSKRAQGHFQPGVPDLPSVA